MKAIIKTIKPKTCANIMNLAQTILIIKNKNEATAIQKLIDENGYAEIYVYCTKGKPLIKCSDGNWYIKDKNFQYDTRFNYYAGFNGKVLARFHCNRVEEIDDWFHLAKDRFSKTCLSIHELIDYLKGKTGYAIHISNLEIFDKPKELSDFYHYVKYNEQQAEENKQDWDFIQITKAPKNYCYIDVSL